MVKVNTANVIEFFNNHYYKIVFDDGTWDFYPSVTTILDAINKPWLSKWRGDLGTEIADRYMIAAQEKGTRIHYACEIMTEGGVVLFSPRNKPHPEYAELYAKYNKKVAIVESQEEMLDVIKIKKMLSIVHPIILHTEMTVFSFTNKWAGTLDLLLNIEEGEYLINGAKKLYLPCGIYVCDYKTGSAVGQEAHMQISAYAECVKEMGLFNEIEGGLIFHTQGKTRKGIEGLATIYCSKEDMEKDYNVFKNVAELWHYQFESEKPKLFTFPDRITLETEIDEIPTEE